jgi:UDP-glucuronate 4-epimerase
MKIFLTGTAGFIGFHTAKVLLERGDEVVGLDNFNPYYDPALKKARADLLRKYPTFRLITGDINDARTINSLMPGVDRVCHLAALAGVRYSFEHPEEYIHTNVVGTFALLEAVRKHSVPGFIYASSSSVYGANEKLPFAEEDRVDHPLSLYGTTKRENELLAHTYHHMYGIPVTGLRFFTVYGPYGRPDMALFLFTEKVLKGEALPIYGEGKMQRDFTYIDDIVAGTVAAIDKNYPEEIFNLGSGRKEELLDFVAMIEKSCLKSAKHDLLPMQPGDFRASHADIAKAKKMLGYSPKTSIAEGIPRFIRWYREYYGV